MANTAQAKKRARQAEQHRQHNASLRSMVRTYMKKVYTAVSDGDKTLAEESYKTAVPIIDRMSSKGLLHKNKAARHKSRLSMHIKAMSDTAPVAKAKVTKAPKAAKTSKAIKAAKSPKAAKAAKSKAKAK